MFRKLSVFFDSRLREHLEIISKKKFEVLSEEAKRKIQPKLDSRRKFRFESKALQAALAFPGDLVRQCMTNTWGSGTRLYDYVPSKSFGRGHSENYHLMEAFRAASRIEATISLYLQEGWLEVVVRFFMGGKSSSWYDMTVHFDAEGKGMCGYPCTLHNPV